MARDHLHRVLLGRESPRGKGRPHSDLVPTPGPRIFVSWGELVWAQCGAGLGVSGVRVSVQQRTFEKRYAYINIRKSIIMLTDIKYIYSTYFISNNYINYTLYCKCYIDS